MLPKLVPPKGSALYATILFCSISLSYIFGLGFIFTSSFSLWAQTRFRMIAHFSLEILALSYSHHRMVCSEKVKEITAPQLESFEEYQTVTSNLVSLFGNLPLEEALKICRDYKINYLVVKDTDAILKNPDGWVWKFPIVASNEHARAVKIFDVLPE